MEKGSTREQILEAALDLFAVNGYEATSISQLADAVGIRKASLYSHFANKQDILDTVVETVLKGYADHSIFVRADWDDLQKMWQSSFRDRCAIFCMTLISVRAENCS